jgi:predicted nucleic acid-binding protein
MIGLDTGYFVALLQGDSIAVKIWKELINGTEEAVVSCLTLFELERLSLRGAIEQTDVILEAIHAVCKVGWLEGAEIISRAARLSHGIGTPSVDSLILATFEAQAATTIYTTDSHLTRYQKEGVKVVVL